MDRRSRASKRRGIGSAARGAYTAACLAALLASLTLTVLSGLADDGGSPERGTVPLPSPTPVDDAGPTRTWIALFTSPADAIDATSTALRVTLGPEIGPDRGSGATSPAARASRRTEVYRALDAAGTSALAPALDRLRAMEGSGQVDAIEAFPALGAVALRAGPETAARIATLPGLLELRPNRQYRLVGQVPVGAGASKDPARSEEELGRHPEGPDRPTEGPDRRSGALDRTSRSLARPSEGFDRTASPGSEQIFGNLTPDPEAWHLEAIGAGRGWLRYGMAGEGSTVAVLDTGADWQHPLLAERYRGREAREHALHWFDAVGSPAAPRPLDPHGHGSMVTGLVAGRQGRAAWGAAPAAEWIAARVFDGAGRSSDLWLLRGAAWTLAPGRDGGPVRPDLAPDVVNGSWSLDNGADPLMDRMIATWLAMDILPVFAAGNIEDGADLWGRILSPAGHPEVIGVGAATSAGLAWSLSRGGPGFHDAVKPDLIAPGVALRSAAPGGGWQTGSGSSMASPQVAGAAVLLAGLRPDLRASDRAALLRRSAADRGPIGPEGEQGWGLLDIEAALEAAASAGLVSGQVLEPSGRPAVGALLEARAVDGGSDRFAVEVDAAGGYRLLLAAGRWNLTAERPDLGPASLEVELVAGQSVERDLRLDADPPEPRAWLQGRVTDRDRRPIAGAEIRLLGRDWSARSDGEGGYRLALPAGESKLRVSADGRRAQHANLTLAPGELRARDWPLAPAPRILLVDADAWDGERVAPYLARGLEDAGYAVERWSVDRLDALPSVEWLSEHEILLWSQVHGSPGWIDRRRADEGLPPVAVAGLRAFFEAGSRPILAGQDLSLHDLLRGNAPDYLRQIFGVELLRSRSWTEPTAVRGEGPFAGLDLDLAWPRGAPKLRYFEPDVLRPLGPAARPLLRYADGGVAAIGRADEAGRAIFLGFGPESAGDRAQLADLLDRAIGWLEGPAMQLSADPPDPAPGERLRLTIDLRAGRAGADLDLRLRLPPSLTVEDAGELEDEDAGWLSWTGRLAAEQARELSVEARYQPTVITPDRGPRLEVELWRDGRVIAEGLTFWPRLADLRASRLSIEPGRIEAARPVTLRLDLENAGALDAAEPSVELRFPTGLAALTPSLRLSSGEASWLPDANGLRWQPAALPAGAATDLTLQLLPAGPAGSRHVEATITDPQAGRIERGAWLSLAGPELQLEPLAPLPGDPVAGQAFTLSLALRNEGGPASAARLAIELPEGIDPEPPVPGEIDGRRWEAWRGALPAGGAQRIDLRLRARPDALRGRRVLSLTLEDGLQPAAPITERLELRLRRADIGASRAVILPDRVLAGGTVSLTILAANHGDAPARIAVTDTHSPGLQPIDGSLRYELGTLRREPGVLHWSLELPPADGSGYAASPASAGSPPGPVGTPLPAPDAEGVAGPIDLGLAFPFQREVYTRAWLGVDGWLAFAPPPPSPLGEPGLGPGGLDRPGVAVLWRAGQALEPRLTREAEAVRLNWLAEGRVLASLRLRADGGMALRFGPGADPSGALVGLRFPDGEHRLLGPSEVSDSGVDLRAPSGWARLHYQSRVGNASEPNRRLGATVQIATRVHALSISPTILVNPAGLSASRLVLSPRQALAGSQVACTLTLAAEGLLALRDPRVEIELPASAELLPDGRSPGLRYDAARHSLSWWGELTNGQSLPLHWRLRLGPELSDGARVRVRARLVATGLEPRWLEADLQARASALRASRKLAARRLARSDERLRFELRLVNEGPSPVPAWLIDRLPPELDLVEGSLRASTGPAPVWDAADRRIRWSGSVPAGQTESLWLEADLRGDGGASNEMRVLDGLGYALVDRAEIGPVRARQYFPILQTVARSP